MAVLLLYMRMLSTRTTTALMPLSIPATFIHRCCGCLVLTICLILLPQRVLHHINIQTKIRSEPWIDVWLYRMLLRRHELVLILLLHGRIWLRKAELWWKLRGKSCILRCAIILPSCWRHYSRSRRQWCSRTSMCRGVIFCAMW